MRTASNPGSLLCPAAGIGVMLFLRASLVSGAAGTVTLAWNPNTEPDLAGYNLYYGTTPGFYAHRIPLGSTTTHTVSNLAPGAPYYFAVTAVNTAELESDPSNEIIVKVPPQRPMGIAVMPFACMMSFTTETNRYVLTVGNTNTCVSLAAALYATESSPLNVLWFDGGELIAEGLTMTNCLSPGSHVITVTAMGTNGASYSASMGMTFLSPAEAIELCTTWAEAAPLDRKDKRPLVASLVSAANYFRTGDVESGISQLCAFQTKCRSQISLIDPITAERLASSAKEIVDAVICLAETGNLGRIAALRRRCASPEEKGAIPAGEGNQDECACSLGEHCSSGDSTC